MATRKSSSTNNSKNRVKKAQPSNKGSYTYIGKTKAAELIMNAGGSFFSAHFVKKSKGGKPGQLRKMTAKLVHPQSTTDLSLGYIGVYDAMDGYSQKRINAQTLQGELRIAGRVYRVR